MDEWAPSVLSSRLGFAFSQPLQPPSGHTHALSLFTLQSIWLQKPLMDHRQDVQPCPAGCSHLLTQHRAYVPLLPSEKWDISMGKFPLCTSFCAAGFPSACLEGSAPSCSSKTGRLFWKAMPGKNQPFPSRVFGLLLGFCVVFLGGFLLNTVSS